jgi:hypothetical protein
VDLRLAAESEKVPGMGVRDLDRKRRPRFPHVFVRGAMTAGAESRIGPPPGRRRLRQCIDTQIDTLRRGPGIQQQHRGANGQRPTQSLNLLSHRSNRDFKADGASGVTLENRRL